MPTAPHDVKASTHSTDAAKKVAKTTRPLVITYSFDSLEGPYPWIRSEVAAHVRVAGEDADRLLLAIAIALRGATAAAVKGATSIPQSQPQVTTPDDAESNNGAPVSS